MWRAFWFLVMLFGIPAVAFGQADSSDSQTLHALLSEVRAIHQDLLSSMAKVQKSQILLSRLETQQASVVRASDRLNAARGRLSDAQDHQRHATTDIKRLEDALNTEENLTQQKQLRDILNHSKSELEDWTAREQQLQAEEIEVEQQLRIEQDKFTMLEAQLDELVRSLGSAAGKAGRVPN
jgi:predicted nuclease with TOPRIM domain